MYQCENCGLVFAEPLEEEICMEDYNGVSSLFDDRHYETFHLCPGCRSTEFEIIDEEEDDE